MKLVVISDTHGGHEALGTLRGDVLIHCGDVEHLFRRNLDALAQVDDWFGRQDFAHILCVGGNHDRALERRWQSGAAPFQNATFLHDSTVEIGGLRVHGSSWVPQLRGHAFYADDDALARAWQQIPDAVDVLITHTPPIGVLDQSSRGLVLGCPQLGARLRALSPRLHCFGHVHASSGCVERGGTTFVNASMVNSRFEVVHRPWEFDL